LLDGPHSRFRWASAYWRRLGARFAGTGPITAITVTGVIFYANAAFWVALMAIMLFSVRWNWLVRAFGTTWSRKPIRAAHVSTSLPSRPAGDAIGCLMATYDRMTRARCLEVNTADSSNRACQGPSTP